MQEKPGEDFYSVEKAAKLLGRTPERIRQMLHAGELEGSTRTTTRAHRGRFTRPPSTHAETGAEARAARTASKALRFASAHDLGGG
jgi:hypothetical protein